MKGLAPLMSSARTGDWGADCWQTPDEVLDLVRSVGPIDLDPCTVAANPTRASFILTGTGANGERTSGGLNPIGWPGYGLVYVNAPYSEMKQWAERLAFEVKRTGIKREYIALVPARTDTRWWQTLTDAKPARVCFWRGRIKFKHPDGTPGQSAPFPSAVFYYGADDQTFTRVFSSKGWIVKG